MFLHLGDNCMVCVSDVIAIVDASGQQNTVSHQEVILISSSEDIRSYIITPSKIYGSPISSMTLKKRAQLISEGGE